MLVEGEFEIDTAVDGGVARLIVVGDIDLATADRLHDAIADAAAIAGVGEVVVDLAQVGFCDSTGIGAMMRARGTAQKHEVDVQVVALRDFVRRTLEVAGVLDVLTTRA